MSDDTTEGEEEEAIASTPGPAVAQQQQQQQQQFPGATPRAAPAAGHTAVAETAAAALPEAIASSSLAHAPIKDSTTPPSEPAAKRQKVDTSDWFSTVGGMTPASSSKPRVDASQSLNVSGKKSQLPQQAAGPSNVKQEPVTPIAGAAVGAAASAGRKRKKNAVTEGVAGAAAGFDAYVKTEVKEEAYAMSAPVEHTIICAELVVKAPAAHAGQAPNAIEMNGMNAVPNFKAFRRNGRLSGSVVARTMVPLVQHAEERVQPDTDAFMREEEQRRLRIEKADELFNANVKATTNMKSKKTR